jgi:predicted aspartyl protease
MSITYLDIEVAHVDRPEQGEKVQFLVDSGAYYSVVPTAILERLGIRPTSSLTLRLANGDPLTRRRGGAYFKYGERVGNAGVVFGVEGDATLLGVTALEAMGLALNPIQRELIELPMLLPTMLRIESSSPIESSE